MQFQINCSHLILSENKIISINVELLKSTLTKHVHIIFHLNALQIHKCFDQNREIAEVTKPVLFQRKM